jgi:hypothetical protein
VADLGTWPKVWKTGEGRYRLSARHHSPWGQRAAGVVAGLLGVGVGLIVFRLFPPLRPGTVAHWVMSMAVAFSVYGAFRALAPVLRLVEAFAPGMALRMTFNRGMIEWIGPGDRPWDIFRYRPRRVFPTEDWQLRVIEHRKAAAEMRRAIERERRGKKARRLYYQQAAEVILDVGPNRAIGFPVAEICFDEHGDKARKLAAAIVLANAASLGTPPEDTGWQDARSGRGMFG